MDRTRTFLVFLGGLLLLGIAIVIALALVTSTSNAPAFASAAAALTFITAAAMGIERTIEALWTVLGGTLGGYWPLNWVRKQADDLVSSLDSTVTTITAQATRTLAQVEGATVWATEQQARLHADVTALSARLTELKGMATDNQRIQLAAASAARVVNGLKGAYEDQSPELKRALATAQSSIDATQDFLASFKDNPGRRMISIFLGAAIGVIVAGMFGLDVFNAVLEGVNTTTSSRPDKLHVIFTGLLIGLGSNPTHEVIRAIQEYKKARKGENTSRPDLS
jgi:hypothetical protein